MGRGTGSNSIAGDIRQPRIEALRAEVVQNTDRVALLGQWPSHIDKSALVGRVPTSQMPASGFDAGIACSLDLIPREAQRLSAVLHAAYTPEAVEQVREEAKNLSADHQTTWWLAACSVCREASLTPAEFCQQVDDFQQLASDADLRLAAAQEELIAMRERFSIKDGWAYGEADGAMQGAYICGHDVAVMRDPHEDLYFVGTYHESLGLEDFEWSSETDARDRPRSGPVHGSRQYVRCHNKEELEAALQGVRV